MRFLPVFLLCALGGTVLAQTNVTISGGEVKLRNADGSSLSVGSERVASDVDMVGVAVINGEVYIDGDRVPTGTRSYKGRKSGKSYRIEWGRDGNVSVAEK